MIRRPPRSTLSSSSAASDVYKRQVPIHRGGIHLVEKLPRSRLIPRHDAVRVRGAIMVNVINSLPDPIYHAYVEDVIIVLGEPILLRGSPDFGLQVSAFGIQDGFSLGVHAQLDLLLTEPLRDRRQEDAGYLAVHQQCLHR